MAKITNGEVLALWNTIESMSQTPYSAAFAHGLLRNRKAIREVVEELWKATAPLPRYTEFEKRRVSLTVTFCEKDGDGNPKVVNGQVFVPEDVQETYKREMAALTAEYGEDIEAQRGRQQQVEEILGQTVEVNLYTLSLSTFPDNVTVVQMEALDPIVQG